MMNRDTDVTRTPSESEELAGKIVRQVFWLYGPLTLILRSDPPRMRGDSF